MNWLTEIFPLSNLRISIIGGVALWLFLGWIAAKFCAMNNSHVEPSDDEKLDSVRAALPDSYPALDRVVRKVRAGSKS